MAAMPIGASMSALDEELRKRRPLQAVRMDG